MTYFNAIVIFDKLDLIAESFIEMAAEFLEIFWTFFIEYNEAIGYQFQLQVY